MAHSEESIVVAENVGPGFTVRASAGGHVFLADETASAGGADQGPDPFSFLLASLGSCILITLRMYAQRKEWPLERAEARLTPTRSTAAPLEAVDVELTLQGALTEEQRERLLDIAGRCPVHRTLAPAVRITKRLVP